MAVLDIRNIYKSYDKNLVLNDISIKIPDHCIFGLLGPNGAGKTTLIRIITQIILPDKGYIFFNDQKLERKHIAKIGYLPEERGLYGKMNVGEQLIYLAKLKGYSGSNAKNEIQRILKEFEILSWWNKKVETLSKGMQQKLQFIVSILHKPELVIFDEPFSGFDPINIDLIKQKIFELREQGTSFIISTHRMDSVEELCDYMVLINKSKKVIEGNIGQIKNMFRKNIYEITFKGIWNDTIMEDNFLYTKLNLADNSDTGLSKIKIRLAEGATVNAVLQRIMTSCEIVSLTEIIPSINDIFISLVKNHDNE